MLGRVLPGILLRIIENSCVGAPVLIEIILLNGVGERRARGSKQYHWRLTSCLVARNWLTDFMFA